MDIENIKAILKEKFDDKILERIAVLEKVMGKIDKSNRAYFDGDSIIINLNKERTGYILGRLDQINLDMIIKMRYESTRLLGLFNSKELTSTDLREFRYAIKLFEEELTEAKDFLEKELK